MGFKLELKYGFWMAALLFVWLLIEMYTGLHGEYMQYVQYSTAASLLVLVVGIYHGLVDKNKEQFAGHAKYGELVLSAGIMVVATAIMTYAFTYIYLAFINPDYLSLVIEKNLAIMKPEDSQAALKIQEAINRPSSRSMGAFARIMAAGFLIMLIDSAFVKFLSSRSK